MPKRTIVVDGRSWDVLPSGFHTIYNLDEFGIVFVSGVGPEREVRVTRYSPHGTRSRAASLAEMAEAQLVELFHTSMPSAMSPETGYRT
jgi:hypothetical protein